MTLWLNKEEEEKKLNKKYSPNACLSSALSQYPPQLLSRCAPGIGFIKFLLSFVRICAINIRLRFSVPLLFEEEKTTYTGIVHRLSKLFCCLALGYLTFSNLVYTIQRGLSERVRRCNLKSFCTRV